jgi:hypothetical protein
MQTARLLAPANASSQAAKPPEAEKTDHRQRLRVKHKTGWLQKGMIAALPMRVAQGYVTVDRDGLLTPKKMRALTKEFFDSVLGKDFLRHTADFITCVQNGPAELFPSHTSLATIWAEAEKHFETHGASYGETYSVVLSQSRNSSRNEKQVIGAAQEIRLLFFEAMKFLHAQYVNCCEKKFPEIQKQRTDKEAEELQKELTDVLNDIRKQAQQKTEIELRPLSAKATTSDPKDELAKIEQTVSKAKERALKLREKIDTISSQVEEALNKQLVPFFQKKRIVRLHMDSLFQVLSGYTSQGDKEYNKKNWTSIFDESSGFSFHDATLISFTRKKSDETLALLATPSLHIYDPRSGMSSFTNKKEQQTDFRTLLTQEFEDEDPLEKVRLETFSKDTNACFDEVIENWKYDIAAMPESLLEAVKRLGVQIQSYEFWKENLHNNTMLQFVGLVPNLSSLSLTGCNIKDNNLAPLQTLKNLRALTIKDSALAPSEYCHLAKLEKIKELSIDTVEIEMLFSHLKSLQHLQRLNLLEERQAGKPYQSILNLLKLVKGKDIELVTQCKALKEITMKHFDISLEGASELLKLLKVKLPHIKLSQTNVKKEKVMTKKSSKPARAQF